jgi:hypothetical protein
VSRFTLERGVRGGQHAAPGRGKRRRFRRVRAWWRRWRLPVLAVVTVFVAIVGWSVGNALTAPGGGSVSERLAEWARDHYLGPLVTLGEELTYQPPKKGGKPSFALTGPAAAPVRPAKHKVQATPLPSPTTLHTLAGGSPLPGEGKWRVLATVRGEPAIYGTELRVSPVYTSVVGGIAWMNQTLVRFQLRPGTEDPGPGNWHAQPYITPGTRRGLLATFNSGFKIASSGGGFFLNGSYAGSLVRGEASVVYYRDGHIAIGNWDETVRKTADVAGVRQNLHLIVNHGHIPANVNNAVSTSWGATLGGGYYVWRSGIGETRSGQIVFAYGPSLDVHEIARLLQRAGAYQGMELDINPAWMSYMYYLPKNHPASPSPVNLLPDQQQPANRYFSYSGRDFTAVYAR